MPNPAPVVHVTEIVFPEHANHYGTLFGGNALMLMSKAAFLAARSHAGTDVVMASCSDAQFIAPVPVGSVLRVSAWVSRIGRTSLTVCVSGSAQALGGDAMTVLKALFEMVAVDADGRPTALPNAYLSRETA